MDAGSPMFETIRSMPVPMKGIRAMMRFPSGIKAISATLPTALSVFSTNSCGWSVPSVESHQYVLPPAR